MIGSGEQYFLNEIYNKRLQPGKYCCATPCFRDDAEDDLHGLYFFKVELIDTEYQDLNAMITIAQEFFRLEGLETNLVKVKSNHLQRDLVVAGPNIELGSYGVREHPEVGAWTYGTGLAEPRFTIAKDQ